MENSDLRKEGNADLGARGKSRFRNVEGVMPVSILNGKDTTYGITNDQNLFGDRAIRIFAIALAQMSSWNVPPKQGERSRRLSKRSFVPFFPACEGLQRSQQ